MDPIFRALADPSRRLLLDRLFERDGQTLSQLERHLPQMTRFGVMKHLSVLAEAGLVIAHKVGREKFHYLNPVPIRRVHDRWLDKFTSRTAGALLTMQRVIEQAQEDQLNDTMTLDRPTTLTDAPTPPRHVFQILIRTTPERLWQALIDPADTAHYYFGMTFASDWHPGSDYVMGPADQPAIVGQVLEFDPPRRLAMTFEGRFNADIAAHAPTVVTYEIEPMGPVCKLTLIHDGLTIDTAGTAGLIDGWQLIVSGLKTWLETGSPLLADATG